MNYTLDDYNATIYAITSSLHKSEKAITKLKETTFQYRLLEQGIKSYHMALNLIQHELDQSSIDFYSSEELDRAIDFYSTSIQRVEKVMPKFNVGSSQHTLGIRRIKAFEIAIELINQTKNLTD